MTDERLLEACCPFEALLQARDWLDCRVGEPTAFERRLLEQIDEALGSGMLALLRCSYCLGLEQEEVRQGELPPYNTDFYSTGWYRILSAAQRRLLELDQLARRAAKGEALTEDEIKQLDELEPSAPLPEEVQRILRVLLRRDG